MQRQVMCQPIRSVDTSRRHRASPFKKGITNEGDVCGLRRLSDYKPLGVRPFVAVGKACQLGLGNGVFGIVEKSAKTPGVALMSC